MFSHLYRPYSYLPYFETSIWFGLLIVAGLEILVVYLWQFRRIPGATPQIANQTIKCLWIISSICIATATSLYTKLFWVSLLQILAISLSYFWFLFIAQISQTEQPLPRWLHKSILIFALLSTLTVLTTPWHGWFWTLPEMNGPILQLTFGPAYNIILWSCYLLNLFNFILGVRWVRATAGLRRRQAIALALISPLITWIAHFAGLFFQIPELRFIGFLTAGIFFTWAFRRWLIYNMLPHAEKTVMQNLIEGLVIVDAQGYIAEINSSAQVLLADLSPTVGSRYQDILNAWPALASLEESHSSEPAEIALDSPHGLIYYQVQCTPLQNAQAQHIGKIILFKDVTHQIQRRLHSLEKQKALSILAERDRLGKELHDGNSQIWTFFQLELRTLITLLGKGQQDSALHRLERLSEIAHSINTDTREAIVSLKSPSSPDLDFSAALKEYISWYKQTHHISIRASLPDIPVETLISHTASVQLLRIIQEALTNIRKHASTPHADISIFADLPHLVARISDTGCGFSMSPNSGPPSKYGLQIMAERAAEAGGTFHITSAPGTGTCITIRFDLNKEALHAYHAG